MRASNAIRTTAADEIPQASASPSNARLSGVNRSPHEALPRRMLALRAPFRLGLPPFVMVHYRNA